MILIELRLIKPTGSMLADQHILDPIIYDLFMKDYVVMSGRRRTLWVKPKHHTDAVMFALKYPEVEVKEITQSMDRKSIYDNRTYP